MEDSIEKMSKSSLPAISEKCDNNECTNRPKYSVTHGNHLFFFCSHKCYLEKIGKITEKEKKQNGRNTERNSSRTKINRNRPNRHKPRRTNSNSKSNENHDPNTAKNKRIPQRQKGEEK